MTTTSHERVVELCDRLTDATLAHRADWQNNGEDQYVWTHSAGSVVIGSRDRDSQPPYELSIRNAAGDQVDELASALVNDDEPAPWNETLADLYRVARRSGLGADELIDALISALPARSDRETRAAVSADARSGQT